MILPYNDPVGLVSKMLDADGILATESNERAACVFPRL